MNNRKNDLSEGEKKPVSKSFSSKEMDFLIEEGLKRTAVKLIEKEHKE